MDNGFTVRYTNKDIMDKLERIELRLQQGQETMKANRTSIVTNRKLIYSAFAFSMAILAFLVGHMAGNP